MPLVLIQYKPSRLADEGVKKLALKMPEIVASRLHAGVVDGVDACLVPDDIEVWCTESGKFDVNTKDLEIIIWAHDFPSRKANLEERKGMIIQDVREFFARNGGMGSLTGFVWILLQPTAFGKL